MIINNSFARDNMDTHELKGNMSFRVWC